MYLHLISNSRGGSRLLKLTVFLEGVLILPELETKGMEAGTGRRSRRSGTRKLARQHDGEVAGDGPGDLRRKSSSPPSLQI
jgi:hypothetical protein